MGLLFNVVLAVFAATGSFLFGQYHILACFIDSEPNLIMKFRI